MANLFTYSPKQVTIAIGGYTLVGWENLTIERLKKGFIPIQGIRGKNTRVRNADTSALITIPLLQSSMGNDVLSRIHELDLVNGTGRLDLTLKDSSGTGVFSSSEAYVDGYPRVVYSGDFEYRVWQIFAQSTTTYTVGGNANVTNIFDSILSTANKAFSSVSNALDDFII